MILDHLRTFLWLRWRLHANQMKRSTRVGLLIQKILIVCGVLAAVLGFSGSLVLGLALTSRLRPVTLLLVWDGLIAAFLLFWLVGLLTELQRSELLSVDKFLHLPVSPFGVFLINYLGSMLTAGLVFFVPAMAGLALALVLSRGPLMIGLFPLIGGFIVMVTALTYQFRGWLAALMVNSRRRRTVLMVATLSFVVIGQIPYLVSRNLDFPEMQEVEGEEVQGEIERIARVANQIVPLGWLPYGVMTSAEGSFLPTFLATVGFLALGGLSLRRSYRTTLRLYGVEWKAPLPVPRPRRQKAPGARSTAVSRPGSTLLERRIPWLSEHASSVALTSFRSLTRAPEAKLVFLTPVIMTLVFGGMFLNPGPGRSEFVRRLVANGAFFMVLMSMLHLAGNQFGFDRDGFRAFVLSSARRRDILLGKNLALMPPALLLGTGVLAMLQYVEPMRADHFLGALIQMPAMYLTFCLVANLLSIFAPMAIASGSLKPVRPKGCVFLMHLAALIGFPVAVAPMLLPLVVESLLDARDWLTGVPVYFFLTLIQTILVVVLYTRLLEWQGRIFQSREQRILESVTASAE